MTFSIDRAVRDALHDLSFYLALNIDAHRHQLNTKAFDIRKAQDRRHVAMVNEFRKRRAERYQQENHDRLHRELRAVNVFPTTNPEGN
jgi:hypothetical protein